MLNPGLFDRHVRHYRFGDYNLDLEGGFLRRGGEEVALRAKSFEVLTFLVERHGLLVTKTELIEGVWRDAAVTDNSLAQCLVEIRRALDDDAQRLIRTVARRGYIFVAPLTVPVVEFPQPKRACAPTLVPAPRKALNWEILDETDAATGASDPRGRQSSVAVLPFANMSADKENEYFGDGLAEEIVNVLARIPGMKVVGRTSSFFFRGKDIEVAEIGRRLNVEHILEGSVRKVGSRLRVSAQLIKAADGFHLWSGRYDREVTDLFAIQDEITEAIAGALRIKLSLDGLAGQTVPRIACAGQGIVGTRHPARSAVRAPVYIGCALHHAGHPAAGPRGDPIGPRGATRGPARRPLVARSSRPAGSVRRYGLLLERGGSALGIGDGS